MYPHDPVPLKDEEINYLEWKLVNAAHKTTSVGLSRGNLVCSDIMNLLQPSSQVQLLTQTVSKTAKVSLQSQEKEGEGDTVQPPGHFSTIS